MAFKLDAFSNPTISQTTKFLACTHAIFTRHPPFGGLPNECIKRPPLYDILKWPFWMIGICQLPNILYRNLDHLGLQNVSLMGPNHLESPDKNVKYLMCIPIGCELLWNQDWETTFYVCPRYLISLQAWFHIALWLSA